MKEGRRRRRRRRSRRTPPQKACLHGLHVEHEAAARQLVQGAAEQHVELAAPRQELAGHLHTRRGGRDKRWDKGRG